MIHAIQKCVTLSFAQSTAKSCYHGLQARQTYFDPEGGIQEKIVWHFHLPEAKIILRSANSNLRKIRLLPSLAMNQPM